MNSQPSPQNSVAPKRTAGRMAVVDIGSNTIRLVVYDTPNRLPIPIFNEKSSCQLGAGLALTGRLNPEGVECAVHSLKRFIRLTEAMGVERMDLVATAAVRDASDGPDFVKRIEGSLGVTIQIPSGPEEAQLAALGLLSGIPNADGVLVDMGGGSVDVVELNAGNFGRTVSLPFGHLRLPEAAQGDIFKAREIVDVELENLQWLHEGAGRTLYAIGGSWRTLGRLFIEQMDYPLHVIDEYTLASDDARRLCQLVANLSKESIKEISGVAKGRAKSLPYAAMVLGTMIAKTKARQVVFSGFSMREGQLLKMLPVDLRGQDPLLSGCAAMAERTGRFAITGQEIYDWISPLFPPGRDAESRLRLAASMLSDMGWSEHPDYRAEHSFLRTLRLPFAGLSHAERVFLALAIYVRYNGDRNNQLVKSVGSLMTDYDFDHANVTGLALRLAHTISGSAPGILSGTLFELEGNTLRLRLPENAAEERDIFAGEAVGRRFKTLARSLGREAIIE
ncbi:MAG: Ppx/GppA family phosphatase [Rhodospirillales bacterium]|nr:Ppx/GppA family phosphatase [Rhodospirillales bacterium]